MFLEYIKKKTLWPPFMDTATSRRQFTIHRIPNFTMISVSSFVILIILLCVANLRLINALKNLGFQGNSSLTGYSMPLFYHLSYWLWKKKIVNQLEWFILNQEPLPGLHHWQNIVLWKKKNQIKKYIKKLVWIDLKKHDKNIKVMVMTLSFCCSYYIL